MTKEKIKNFIMAALGDVAEPRAFAIEQNKGSDFYVLVVYHKLVYVSKEELIKEWEQAKLDNPEFAEVNLYF